MKRDWNEGFYDKLSFLPGVAYDMLADAAWGAPDPVTGNRGWGGLYGVLAKEVENHGPFFLATGAVKLVGGAIGEVGTMAAKYLTHAQATFDMTPNQQARYLKEHGSDIPVAGFLFDYVNAVDSGDKVDMARSAVVFAMNVAPMMEGIPRPRFGSLAAAEQERLIAESYERFGHAPMESTATKRVWEPEDMGDVRAAEWEQQATRATRATRADTAGLTPTTSAVGPGLAIAEQMATLKARAGAVETPTIPPHLLKEREQLYARAEKFGAIKLTSAQASRLLGVDEPILLGARTRSCAGPKGPLTRVCTPSTSSAMRTPAFRCSCACSIPTSTRGSGTRSATSRGSPVRRRS